MHPALKDYSAVLARILFAALFIISGVGKISRFTALAGVMAAKGVPMSEALLAVTIALEIAGGLMIAAGWHARWAALAFFLWLIPVTIVFHKFWGIEPTQVQAQMNHFLKNLAIMGAALLLFVHGPGPYSLRRD